MSEQKPKKGGKFITGIVIGGAMGSLVSWAFGSKRRRKKIAEKAHEYYEKGKEGVEYLAEQYEDRKEKKGWLSRLFGRK